MASIHPWRELNTESFVVSQAMHKLLDFSLRCAACAILFHHFDSVSFGVKGTQARGELSVPLAFCDLIICISCSI